MTTDTHQSNYEWALEHVRSDRRRYYTMLAWGICKMLWSAHLIAMVAVPVTVFWLCLFGVQPGEALVSGPLDAQGLAALRYVVMTLYFVFVGVALAVGPRADSVVDAEVKRIKAALFAKDLAVDEVQRVKVPLVQPGNSQITLAN